MQNEEWERIIRLDENVEICLCVCVSATQNSVALFKCHIH